MLIMICTTIITINSTVVSNLPLHENVSKSRVLVFLGTKPRNGIYLFVRQTPTMFKALGLQTTMYNVIASLSLLLVVPVFPPNPVSVIIYFAHKVLAASRIKTGITGSKVSYYPSRRIFAQLKAVIFNTCHC